MCTAVEIRFAAIACKPLAAMPCRFEDTKINKIQEMQTMQKTRFKKALSFAVCMVLVAAIALFTTGCNDKKEEPSPVETASFPSESTNTSEVKPIEIGQGKNQFNFSVTLPDGVVKNYIIKTDKTIVGEALQELELISGEEGPYGLYVKVVNGVELDYDTHGKYWAFYINGEMAMSGVDITEITPDTTYSFVATAA